MTILLEPGARTRFFSSLTNEDKLRLHEYVEPYGSDNQIYHISGDFHTPSETQPTSRLRFRQVAPPTLAKKI